MAAEFNWTTKDRIRSHEEYLRGGRSSIAAQLNWTTGESGTPTPDAIEPDVKSPDVKFPDTLMDDPKDSDDAVDHSDDQEARDTSVSFVSLATNWDSLLDTAGIPTDGVPPDPLANQQAHEQEQQARLPKPDPAAQHKAAQKQRAGRGVEGCGDEGPTNPMDSGAKYDWDHLAGTPRL